MVTTPRHAPRPALHLSLRHFLRASNGTSPRKRRHSSRNRQNNDPPWRGNFRPWPALPRSGIRARLPLVPMDRSLPRRCPKHSRPLDDVDGRPLLAQRRSPPHRSLRAYTILGNLSSPRNLREPYHRNRRSPGHSTPLDHPSPRHLPWPLESYINGVHVFGNPQPWLFPIFPWSAFAFVGLAVGFFLFTNA